ncbi:MAG: hypothetical protein OXB84_09405 [Halobacteriovoraceae bacterium]|nr:hypothetical protein [Halobacteriovoraceae bacterium]
MKNNNPKIKVSWAEAVRDVVIKAIETGQLPALLISVIVILIIWKIPEDQLLLLLQGIIKRFQVGEMISYPILLLCILGWFFHVKILKNNFTREYERIGKEKSYLQNKISRVDLKSSDD